MSKSWQVYIESVESLKSAEYRVGDYTERAAHQLMGSMSVLQKCNQKGKEAKEKRCKALGDVAVEVQAGAVRKRTSPFKVSGTALVEVHESLVLPEPAAGEVMVLRVLRVGHMQDDSLVGEAEVAEASGESVRLPLHRKTGKGKEKGVVSLCVSAVEVSSNPVCSETFSSFKQTATPPSGQSLKHAEEFLKQKRNRAVDKYMSKQGGPAELMQLRRPLLEKEKAASSPSVGECEVAIEGIKELTVRAQRPYFLLRLDGTEFLVEPDKLAHGSEAELTHRFPVSKLQCSLCIYCYDDLGRDRCAPLGRILLPLADLFWGAGEAPSVAHLRAVFGGEGVASRRYTAHFMPVSSLGDGRREAGFVDRFQPARLKNFGTCVAASGMYKKQAFGSVSLRLQVTLSAACNPPMRCYFAAVQGRARSLLSGEQESEQPAVAPTSDIMGLLQSTLVTQTARNFERLGNLFKAPSGGLLRWLREKPWHGYAAGTAWALFCAAGLFPPPFWAWPLYLWALLALNGALVAQQRARDWSEPGELAYPVWNEELVPKQLCIGDLVANFTSGVGKMERNTRILLGTLERFFNLFNFADGTATLLGMAAAGLAALALSALLLCLALVDTGGTWSSALGGLILCVALSTKGRGQGGTAAPSPQTRDPIGNLEKLNRVLECVPDQAELEHRYIATKVQCALGDTSVVLQVIIVSASGLRNADHLPGQGLSDPYCVCQIPGKPASRFQTKVVDDSLDPVWEHVQEVQGYTIGDSLDFVVWDKDPGTSGDLLGRAKLAGSQFYPSGFDGEVELKDAGKGFRPLLKLKVNVYATIMEP